MATLPPALWVDGYTPTEEDFQHINDGVEQWCLSTFAQPSQLPALPVGTIGIQGGVLLLAVPPAVVANRGVMRINLRGVAQAADGDLYLRISVDNAVSWLQDPTQYQGLLITEAGALAVSNDHFPITGGNAVVAHVSWGMVEIDFSASVLRFDIASGPAQSRGNGWWQSTSTVTHILVASVRSTLVAGQARIDQVPF